MSIIFIIQYSIFWSQSHFRYQVRLIHSSLFEFFFFLVKKTSGRTQIWDTIKQIREFKIIFESQVEFFLWSVD